MKRLVDWLQQNHVAVMFTVAVTAAASLYTYYRLPKDVFPDGDFPRFQIIADIGFASLNETELNVTRPIEEAVKTVPDVVEVRSVTERGTSTIDLYLKWGTDLNQAFQYVQSKLSQVRSALPSSVDLDVVRMTTSALPMSEYGIWSEQLDEKALYTTIRYGVMPKLIGIDGIYGLKIVGGQEPEVWIQFDPQQLIRYNLDTAALGTVIANANKVSFLGNVVQDSRMLFAIGGEKMVAVKQLGETVVASRMGEPIHLREIARIEEGHAEIRRIVSVNGHRGLVLDIQKQRNADGVTLSRKLDQTMQEIEQASHGQLHVTKWDLSDFVSRSIHGILFDIVLGTAIILLIILYVMNRWRYALPIIFVLPVVMMFECVVLKLLGLTVNIMTLGGLAAAIGIIADNAIVITEHYVTHQAGGTTKNPLAVSLASIVPITMWATAASIVVFIPLNILSGVSGLFFKPLATTLATTIIISLLMAVLVLPVFINYFIERHPADQAAVQDRAVFTSMRAFYLRTLETALRLKRVVVVLAVLLLMAAGVAAFITLPSGFLPEWDEGDIVLDYLAPASTSIFGTDETLNRVEAIIKQLPDIQMYVRKTGTHLGTPFAAPNVGEIIILLKQHRHHTTFDLMKKLEADVSKAIPEIHADLHQILPDRLGDLRGTAKPIVVNIFGNDSDALRSVAQDVAAKLETIPGLNGVLVDLPAPQQEVHVAANEANAALLGVGIGDVFHHAQLALYGEVISHLQRGLQTIPVRQFYAGDYRHHLDTLSEIPIYTPNGGILPLGKLATFTLMNHSSEVHHDNGSIVVSVNAEISGRALGDAVRDIRKALSTMKDGAFSLELRGNYRDQQQSFRELLFVLLVSIVLILAILLFIFESYRTALAVFFGTVCSAAFVVLGLSMTRTEFDVSSFTGLITVMGIVVNNGILVIEFVERFRASGRTLTEALKEAGHARFRPVLITNLAAIAGFLPMALNIGHGGEVLRPFSIAMISGLIGSMLCSLLVMPLFYDILHQSRLQQGRS